LLYAVTGKLEATTLGDRELLTNHPLFDELYRLSLRLSHCISGGKSSEANNYAVMIPNNALPVACFSEKRTSDPDDGNREANGGNPDSIDGTVYKDTLPNFL